MHVAVTHLRFHHANARHTFLNARAQVREPRLRFLREIVNPLAEVSNAERDRGQRQQRQQRQLPVDFQHQHDGKHRDNDRIRRVHDPGPEQHPNVAEVVRNARHQIAGPVLLVKRHRKRFQMLKQIGAQLVLDLPGNADDQPPHCKPEGALT